jgi:hypothetical protein
MQTRIIPILALVFADGCFLLNPVNPCAEGSPLQQDPAVAADCQACGMSPCPNETGETGDEVEVTSLTCDSYAINEDGTGPQFCFVGNYDIPITNPNFDPYIHKNKADCPQLSNEFPCDRTWHAITSNHAGGQPPPPDQLPENGDSAGTMCVLCQTDNGDKPWDPGHKVPAADNAGWRLCGPDWLPKPHPALNDEMPAGSADWIDDLACDEYTDPGFVCPLGFVALDQPDYEHNGKILFSTFTCTCHGSDETCQPDAVCEAGWTIDGEDLYPSLCTWDDGSGGNGIAPEGPKVYGLARWEDGIVRKADSITITGEMLLTLVPEFGSVALLNDDQRVDALGTITHCGRASLCAYLGLSVGDTPLVEQRHINALTNTGRARIEIITATGRSRWLTVFVDFDGRI